MNHRTRLSGVLEHKGPIKCRWGVGGEDLSLGTCVHTIIIIRNSFFFPSGRRFHEQISEDILCEPAQMLSLHSWIQMRRHLSQLAVSSYRIKENKVYSSVFLWGGGEKTLKEKHPTDPVWNRGSQKYGSCGPFKLSKGKTLTAFPAASEKAVET